MILRKTMGLSRGQLEVRLDLSSRSGGRSATSPPWGRPSLRLEWARGAGASRPGACRCCLGHLFHQVLGFSDVLFEVVVFLASVFTLPDKGLP